MKWTVLMFWLELYNHLHNVWAGLPIALGALYIQVALIDKFSKQ